MARKNKFPVEEVVRKIKEVHGDSIVMDESTYTYVSKKATFVHKIYGKWENTPFWILRGGSHKKAAYNQKTYSIEEIRKKIKEVHGGTITIVEDSFVGLKKKATFIHEKYGEFSSTPASVFAGVGPFLGRKEKARLTNLKKYGVEYAVQNKDVALKVARSSNISTILRHWKTGEELICQGSYELKTVVYLNNNKINYLWQPQAFDMLNGKTYRPDLFLIDGDKWIEIKGFFRKDALQKWNWFKTQFPTAELWDRNRLKEMGIL